jgi:hypothetical protein
MSELRAVLIVDHEQQLQWLECFCLFCDSQFQSSIHFAPTWRDADGDKQPICPACLEQMNNVRREAGVEPFQVGDNAYEKEFL